MSKGPAGGLLLGAVISLAAVAGCATGADSGFHVPDARDDSGGGDVADEGGTDTATCPTGQLRCGADCIDPLTDTRNCGGCGNACGASEVCSGGVCAGDCTPPLTLCGSLCVDLASSADNCGTCGNACPGAPNADGVCASSACTVRCRAGWSDVDGIPGCEYECAFASPTESCNGADDDCDGAVDEGFPCTIGESVSCTTTCGSGGNGACTVGCEVPNGAGCTPPAETCNGADDDCDTVCDNGLGCCLGQNGACTTSGGAPGVRNCGPGCVWGPCTATGEACNGIDDDGDGVCDNGFDCCLGSSGACTTVCGSTGTRTCSSSCTWSSCTPPPETCNGIDDDCDGVCDDGVGECCRGATGTCSTTCGSLGTRTCSTSCAWSACTPPGETCNGVDDNCNGICDDGFGCCAGSTSACTTACGTAGSASCSGSCSLGSCCAATETCGNLCDDNCNGSIDEGCTSSNDTCAGATPITLNAGRTTVTGSTAAATSDDTCASGNDVWYRFSLAQREVVFLNTYGTSFDTKLGLRAGSCGAATTNCTDDTCGMLQTEVTVTLDAGTYYILVEAFSGIGGDFTLNIEHLPVGNDGVARVLALGTSTLTGTTSGTGLVGGCGRGVTAPEHLYYWTQCPSAVGGSFTANTCGVTWDTVLFVRAAPTATDTCDDDGCGYPASSLTATIAASHGLYGFYVDGFSSYFGTYSAAVTRP
jgi:hypothetical protein